MATAYKNAGQSTAEADNAFAQARQRFEHAWNRDNGEHPINDAQQVQLATTSLGVQAGQLPKIAADLEGIAASLAEAQRSSAAVIHSLDGQLERLDKELGEMLDLEKDPHLTEQERSIIDTEINSIEQQAIDDTRAALQQVTHIRDGYAGTLNDAEAGCALTATTRPWSKRSTIQQHRIRRRRRCLHRAPAPKTSTNGGTR